MDACSASCPFGYPSLGLWDVRHCVHACVADWGWGWAIGFGGDDNDDDNDDGGHGHADIGIFDAGKEHRHV